MRNIFSYVGMNLQSEVCLWSLLGLLRTVFDATLFKVNANLKQVWQMNMPEELSLPVQRILRTMISGIMLVQCFTVYVYMATYIVLLYPVFLEERPVLVLPWLLLAAVRSLLCELTSLALGLGTCVLIGAARPPCIKFVVLKIVSIIPAMYMWLLILSYYHNLKMASAYNTLTSVLAPGDKDYGLELAIRRRRTKSLYGEEQLRRKIISNFNDRRSLAPIGEASAIKKQLEQPPIQEDSSESYINNRQCSTTSNLTTVCYDDWLGPEIPTPRDTDRILEQFVLMSLRIFVYLQKEHADPTNVSISHTQVSSLDQNIENASHHSDNADATTLDNKRENNISYMKEYTNPFKAKTANESFNSLMNDVNFNNKSNNDLNGMTKLNNQKVTPKKKVSLSENGVRKCESVPSGCMHSKKSDEMRQFRDLTRCNITRTNNALNVKKQKSSEIRSPKQNV